MTIGQFVLRLGGVRGVILAVHLGSVRLLRVIALRRIESSLGIGALSAFKQHYIKNRCLIYRWEKVFDDNDENAYYH